MPSPPPPLLLFSTTAARGKSQATAVQVWFGFGTKELLPRSSGEHAGNETVSPFTYPVAFGVSRPYRIGEKLL